MRRTIPFLILTMGVFSAHAQVGVSGQLPAESNQQPYPTQQNYLVPPRMQAPVNPVPHIQEPAIRDPFQHPSVTQIEQPQQPPANSPVMQVPPPAVEQPVAEEPKKGMEGSKDVAAVLLVIDKVYAKKKELTIPVDTVGQFGDIDIHVTRCMTNQNDAPPHYAALLEVFDHSGKNGRERIFSGWMFDSTPSLSALEHPHYDVSILRCEPLKKDKDAAEDKKETKEKSPAPKKENAQ